MLYFRRNLGAPGMKVVAELAVILAMVGTVHAQTVLSADVIKQSFAGNTGEIAGRSTTFVFWAADGTQRLQNLAGADKGTWRVTDAGDFCGKWTRLRNGTEVCAPVVDLGGGSYEWGDLKFRILLGNPKEL